MEYMVYGKNNDMKKFRPYNVLEKTLNASKINGTLFSEDELEGLKEEVSLLNEKHPNYTFEVRRA